MQILQRGTRRWTLYALLGSESFSNVMGQEENFESLEGEEVMEEHVELALSRWAKEYNKEWDRMEQKRTNDSLSKAMSIIENARRSASKACASGKYRIDALGKYKKGGK